MHHLMVVQTSSPKKTNKTNCWKSIDQSQPSYQLVQDFFHQHIHRPRNVMKGSKGLELRKYFKVWPCRQQRWQCKVCWGNRRKEGNKYRFCKKNKVVLVQNVRRNRQHIYIYIAIQYLIWLLIPNQNDCKVGFGHATPWKTPKKHLDFANEVLPVSWLGGS